MAGEDTRDWSVGIDDQLSSPTATEVGSALLALRRERGITGAALGELVGFSQAKISKIERGALRPSPGDVERISLALDASREIVADLVRQAIRLRSEGVRPRLPRRGSAGQQDLYDVEGRAGLIRVFEPLAVPGLLQISEYARRVIQARHALNLQGGAGTRSPETAAMVSLRARRQERLYDDTKTFEFLLMEPVLANRFAPPGYMLAQVDRIEQVSRLPNVTVRIVPMTAYLGLPPPHGFSIFDDRVVVTETTDSMISRDYGSVDFYSHLFDEYAERSAAQLDPIFDDYRTQYASLALPKEVD